MTRKFIFPTLACFYRLPNDSLSAVLRLFPISNRSKKILRWFHPIWLVLPGNLVAFSFFSCFALAVPRVAFLIDLPHYSSIFISILLHLGWKHALFRIFLFILVFITRRDLRLTDGHTVLYSSAFFFWSINETSICVVYGDVTAYLCNPAILTAFFFNHIPV